MLRIYRMLSLFLVLTICCNVYGEDSTKVEIERDKLENIYAKLTECNAKDSLILTLDEQLRRLIQTNNLKDTLLITYVSQLRLYKEAISSFKEDFGKRKAWYNNMYLGFLAGAITIYLSSEVVSNVK